MRDQIRKTEDLGQDLAKTHKALARKTGTADPQIEKDFEQLQRDGFVILKGLISSNEIEEIRKEAAPLLGQKGRNNFEGLSTQRVYNVLGKSRKFDRLVDHPRVLGLLDQLFMPNYLLSQSQIINILPGEEAQLLHYDDAFYRWPRPRPPLGAATIWAIDDFTEENGATIAIPGSHAWGHDRAGMPEEGIPSIMEAGSCILFLGTLWHGGGANSSSSARLALTCQYCETYLRQQENFLLELSKETVRSLSPEIQSLVGYSINPPFMGMVEGKHPLRTLESD